MNRGEPLTWGITIERYSTQWTVRLAGSEAPDWYFDTWDELTEWLEDQHEGWKIGRMAKGEAHMTTETGTVQVDLAQFGGDSSEYVKVEPIDAIQAQVTPDPSLNVVWDRPGLPAGLVWNVPLLPDRVLYCICDGVPPAPDCPIHGGRAVSSMAVSSSCSCPPHPFPPRPGCPVHDGESNG